MEVKRNNSLRGVLSILLNSLLLFFSFLFASCADDDLSESPVPALRVNYTCNVTTINAAMQQTDVPHLDCQPGYVLINSHLNVSDVIGVAGLLLYHSAFEDVYYAFDLACPYCYQHGRKAVQIGMNDTFAALCPECKSEFQGVQYGSPAATVGPANKENLPLRRYRAKMINYNTLLVTE